MAAIEPEPVFLDVDVRFPRDIDSCLDLPANYSTVSSRTDEVGDGSNYGSLKSDRQSSITSLRMEGDTTHTKPAAM